MTDKIIEIRFNGVKRKVKEGSTILDVAKDLGVFIPRLCFLEEVHEEGNCRLCSVEVDGNPNLKPACRTTCYEGMSVITENMRTYNHVVNILELMAANHHFECFTCSREENCEFLDLLRRYSISNEYSDLYGYKQKKTRMNISSPAMYIDSSKCVLCGRCVSACEKNTALGILNFNERGSDTYVGPALFHALEDSGCIYCGKCIQACPTGAIREHDDIKRFEQAIHDSNKAVIVQIAPSVRVALGEEFGYPVGTNVEGQMFAALQRLGVNEIMDTNFAADLTIIEEGSELLERISKDGVLPLFTSCSPGWINYVEQYFPEYIPNVSTCKSPQQMAGALIKTYYAEKLGIDPHNIVSVSIMPCVAKKAEAKREEMGRDGYQDVDIVLTTREFARLIRRRGINFRELKPIAPYGELAEYTGAASIFGVSGGVMEAALRTVSHMLVGKSAPIEFKEIRGTDGIKEATYQVGPHKLNVAVVQGGKAIKEFLEMLETSKKQYHFVEFMGCKGGCINGGGQPIVKATDLQNVDVIKERSSALYTSDQKATFRRSDQNEAVKKLYDDYLNKKGHYAIHDLLHTHYHQRKPYSK
ncbi:[FeFe] hydrogenase, group A [Acholeplasma sp. OttesenSCG-928-E16]|nr:[FeFe] hydrogenase, group A [Acholeplasma sp. OttesenSCG-928-E16]